MKTFVCLFLFNSIIEFISKFSNELAGGLLHLGEMIVECEKICPDYQLNDYFYNNISFTFDDSKRKGLELF